MTIQFLDGFDHYMAGDILKKWTGVNGYTPNAADTKISPVYACPPGGMGLQQAGAPWKMFDTAYTTGIIGMNYYVGGVSNAPILAFFDSDAAEQCSLRIDSSYRLTVTRSGTVLATSTNVLSQNTWYHIEFKARIHNTSGSYEARVNGSSAGWIPPSAANQNTRARTNNSYLGISLMNGGATNRYDDIFVLECDNAPNNDFLGPRKVLTCFPIGAGNYAQWTPNYLENHENVSENAGDGDQTFNQSNTPNQIDSFAVSGIPNATIAGIQHVMLARQDTGSGRTIAALQRSGSTDYVGDTKSLASGYTYLLDINDVDPATGVAYTYLNLNAAEFGYKLLS